MDYADKPQAVDISVVIPVGPKPHHKRWLQEAVQSIADQSMLPRAVMMVDDMAGLQEGEVDWQPLVEQGVALIAAYPSWNIGVSAAFNIGVIDGPTEFTLMLGSDDTLEPDAIRRGAEAINAQGANAGRCYFSYPVRYMDTGEEQNAPCNAAIVSKSLWRLTGGFPPEAGAGACDALLLSAMMGAKGEAGDIVQIGNQTMYNVRRHPDMDTWQRGALQGGAIIEIRNWWTQRWETPQWGRY